MSYGNMSSGTVEPKNRLDGDQIPTQTQTISKEHALAWIATLSACNCSIHVDRSNIKMCSECTSYTCCDCAGGCDCEETVCKDCMINCVNCSFEQCPSCIVVCSKCDKPYCMECIVVFSERICGECSGRN